MPEAPEVQTVLSTLETRIKDATIQNVDILYPRLIENESVDEFKRYLIGQSFRQFSRLGKYLIFGMDDYDLIVHLRMEGKFYIYENIPQDVKHIHCIFTLMDGRYLCYHDTRKFGRMVIYPKRENKASYDCFRHVGYDFLDERVDAQYLYQHIHHSQRSIKAALLDQSIIAGIGNIYADEILFSCKLDPRSRCTRISKNDCNRIIEEMRRILNGAIRYGGTTIRSYTSSLGVTGLFQLKLKVHARKNEKCPECDTRIKKIVVAKRGTYLCPHCQKRK